MEASLSNDKKKQVVEALNNNFRPDMNLLEMEQIKEATPIISQVWGAEVFFKEGGKVISSIETTPDINSSKSFATGEVYADKEEGESQILLIDPVGDLEELLSELLNGIAGGINALIHSCDNSLERIVFGRLVHYGTNYYCFELVKGNPYGIVGSFVYKIFRNIAIPFVLLMVLYRFAKASWSSGSGEQRRVFKESIGRCVIVLLLLFLMPNIIDMLIYIKDVLMHYMSGKTSTGMSEMFG